MRAVYLTILLFVCSYAYPQCEPFLRGDVNNDGEFNISDAAAASHYYYNGGQIENPDSLDYNDDGSFDITDVQLFFNFFRGGVSPAQPYPVPGFDCTHDTINICCSPTFDVLIPFTKAVGGTSNVHPIKPWG